MTSAMSDDAAPFKVLNVRTGSLGRILHLGRFSPLDALGFSPGDTVQQAIDIEKHDLNCRLHTAGHIVGLTVRHLV
jgi:Ser-tRNA(Ala) deacylase AlaX